MKLYLSKVFGREDGVTGWTPWNKSLLKKCLLKKADLDESILDFYFKVKAHLVMLIEDYYKLEYKVLTLMDIRNPSHETIIDTDELREAGVFMPSQAFTEELVGTLPPVEEVIQRQNYIISFPGKKLEKKEPLELFERLQENNLIR